MNEEKHRFREVDEVVNMIVQTQITEESVEYRYHQILLIHVSA